MVLGYSLYHLFANTAAGARFANQTRQAIAFEQLQSIPLEFVWRALMSGHISLRE